MCRIAAALRGKFIVLDGIDNVGKTTQLEFLEECVTGWGVHAEDIVIVREPGGTKIGEEIRRLLLGIDSKINMRAEMLLYMAARAQLVDEVIKPALCANKLVLADRFVSSTIAYQGGGGGISFHHIMNAAKIAIDGISPDLTIILDADNDVIIKRRPDLLDRIERRDSTYHARVRQAYINLTNIYPEYNVLINADGSMLDVSGRIEKALNKHFLSE